MDLSSWQTRLAYHFGQLYTDRSSRMPSPPLYAFEHGLDVNEIESLKSDVQTESRLFRFDSDCWAPWVVYATEIGYAYSGDEYWQTFGDITPGWRAYDDRYWLRRCFEKFASTFNGAKPSGRWARHFNIICWPISHAILPHDLQHQLANVLYRLGRKLAVLDLNSLEELGQLIEAASWQASDRFRRFAEQHILTGQITSALLLHGTPASSALILPNTLERIVTDLEQEQSSREWLKQARIIVKSRIDRKGLLGDKKEKSSQVNRSNDRSTAYFRRPWFSLRERVDGNWDAALMVPDLAPIVDRWPSVLSILSEERCEVPGAMQTPLARGRLLSSARRILLKEWPSAHSNLLHFSRSCQELDAVITSHFTMDGDETWLLRIGSDGDACQNMSKTVRPGGDYILLRRSPENTAIALGKPILVRCTGITANRFTVPTVVSSEDERQLAQQGIAVSKRLTVWPVGIIPAFWDGEGRVEWLSSDTPCVAVQTDYDLAGIVITIDGCQREELRISSPRSGLPICFQLPQLVQGEYSLRFIALQDDGTQEMDHGRLEISIRDPHVFSSVQEQNGPVAVYIDPCQPSLEDLWENRVSFQIHGPSGRKVKCSIELHQRGRAVAPFCMNYIVECPVTPVDWNRIFACEVLKRSAAQDAYDLAKAASIRIDAGEYGAHEFQFERKHTPLRWRVVGTRKKPSIALLDDTEETEIASIFRFPFARPDLPEHILMNQDNSIDITDKGGLFFAQKSQWSSAIVVSPQETINLSLGSLKIPHQFGKYEKTVESFDRMLQYANYWWSATPAGGWITSLSWSDVLRAFCCQIASEICGTRWANAEKYYVESPSYGLMLMANEIEHANSASISEDDLSLACFDMLELSLPERVNSFIKFASLHSLCGTPRRWRVRPGGNSAMLVQRGLPKPQICEFALRIASCPGSIKQWIETDIQDGVTQLIMLPLLLAVARYIVVGSNDISKDRDVLGKHIYAGWDWE